ncbi:MAG TPA: cytochrome P450 [Acidimicrobiales bacterium]|nr:cytochrome P450 [Acidimicrobiales bacterium]
MTFAFDPGAPGFVEDPYPTYARMRTEAPVHWSERLGAWMVTRYEDVDHIFRDPTFSSDRTRATKFKGGPPTMRSIQSDPPEYVEMRGAITATLTTSVIEAIRPRVTQLVQELLDGLADRDEFDLIADFAYPLPITVIAELFGVPEGDREQFQEWSSGMARAMDRFYSQAGTGLRDMAVYCASLARARQETPGDDLISALLSIEGLTFQEVVSLCSTLIFAGHETTTNLIGNGVLALLRSPDQLARMRAIGHDVVDVRIAIEEMLRFDSPAQMLSRVVATDVELGGEHLKAGDALLALIGAGNHDPSVFADAEDLDVDRHPNPHLGFGVGLHYCVGAALSRREAQVAIPALLERFPRMRLAGAPRWRDTIVLRGLESLPISVG